MLNIARASFYGWAILLGIAVATLVLLPLLGPPGSSEDYGAGMLWLLITALAAAVGFALALAATCAYFVAWRRRIGIVGRDKAFALASVLALAAFAWPISWLVVG